MRDLLEYILRSIVDFPDDIVIEEEREDDILRFNVTLNTEDYPRVIGKQGLTIKAITDIIRLSDAKDHDSAPERVYVNIKE